jgi:putative thioredoxin
LATTLGLSAADKTAVETFRRDVVEPSMTKLVLIDFWAEWCGPCKALSPVIEKVAADYASKGVVLAKVDTDKNQFIAQQFQIRSIPTVYAMYQGQLVADLSKARTESQLKAMLDQILKQLPIESDEAAQEAELEPLLAMAEDIAAGGDPTRALNIYDQLLEMAPDNAEVIAGRVRALVAAGRQEEAEATLAALPPELAKHPEISRAKATMSLVAMAKPVDDLSAMAARVAAAPDDLQLAYDYAGGLMAAGRTDEAADTLLGIIKADKAWNDGAARTQLLKLFEVVGLENPWVAQQRRRLSAILFG